MIVRATKINTQLSSNPKILSKIGNIKYRLNHSNQSATRLVQQIQKNTFQMLVCRLYLAHLLPVSCYVCLQHMQNAPKDSSVVPTIVVSRSAGFATWRMTAGTAQTKQTALPLTFRQLVAVSGSPEFVH